MEIAKLVLMCLAALCGYGALLGGISAALCPEVFLPGRPPSFAHWPPLALGALWGALDLLVPAVCAGLALGLAANFGPQPALKATFFRRVIPGLVALMAAVALAGATAGYFAARGGWHTIASSLETRVPLEKQPLLAAVWWASLGGLLALFVSAIILSFWAWRKRAHYAQMLRERRG